MEHTPQVQPDEDGRTARGDLLLALGSPFVTEIDMYEAKTRLSELVQRAEQGEAIVITRNGTPVVRLTPVPKPNRLASVRGLFKDNPTVIDERFDELPEHLAEDLGMNP